MLGRVSVCCLAIVLAAAQPAAASSYTWGYTYARDRLASAPVAADAPAVPAAGAAAPLPLVVPLPGRSQSTPVVVGGTWYQWTYWDGGRRGALWTGGLGGGAAIPVTLPGEGGPVVPARGAVRLNTPADAAVSPDGRWVAFGVGARLYWWPSGRPDAGNFAQITGPSHVAAESTSPTFVPDPTVPSGWEVCDGNWDGGFACFVVAPADGYAPQPLARYLVTSTTSADGDGYTAITSSAAWGGPGSDLYFGVASLHDPRVMRLDPRSGAVLEMGSAGAVAAPIWAATAVDGPDVYATDVNGSAYLFDGPRGVLLQVYRSPGPAPNIASPAVAGGSLYLLEGGYTSILRLDRLTLRPSGPAAALDGLSGASAPTLVIDGHLPPELFYATRGGGVDIASVTAATSGTLREVAGWPGAPPGGAYNWTAAVVDGRDVLLWSDGAVATARARGATPAAGPPGFAPGTGGLQIYRLVPRLTAWLSPASVSPGGAGTRLYVLAAPGAVVRVAGGPWAPPLSARPDKATPCPAGVATGAGGNFGIFPQDGGPSAGPVSGCGPFSQTVTLLEALAQRAQGRLHPAFAGLAPTAWQSAGAGYAAWRVQVPGPGDVGTFALRVTVSLPDGGSSRVVVWLSSACPVGWGADAAGRCTIALEPAPSPLGTAGVPATRCAPDLAPGAGGMTQQEYALLCGPLPPWLTDPAVVGCYGSWWNWVRRQGSGVGCRPGAAGG